MANVVFILAALTSLTCGAMLMRGYASSRSPLLLWSSISFLLLFVGNVLLVFDRMIFPDINLQPARTGMTLIGLMALIYGLIWERA